MIAVLLNSASIMWALSSFGSCLIAWQRALMRMARIWLSVCLRDYCQRPFDVVLAVIAQERKQRP
jgi:hypothetical protein